MADAACGPSNALQNFQKHTSVDRTLQQDRLVGRHSPSQVSDPSPSFERIFKCVQGFRSPVGLNSGALDQEFEAFQAGHAGLPQPAFHHPPSHLARPPPPRFAQAPQAPDWASDFQRLNISHTPPVQQQRSPAPNATLSWHQDFMSQQGPAMQAPAFQQNNFGAMSGYGMSGYAQPAFQQSGFGLVNGNSLSEVAQGKQRAQEPVPQFDEAAFERAFADVQQADEQAHAESLRQQQQEASKEQAFTATQGLGTEAATDDLLETEDPALLRIREQRPAVYAALKLRSAVDLHLASEAAPHLEALETMESTHKLTEDASEAKWVVDTLQKISAREAPQEIKTRSERLIRAINERLMSTYPLLSMPIPINQDRIWEELEAAGYTRSPAPEQMIQQPDQQEEQEQKQEHQPRHDDDEMAQTAGRLLERVSDNTSEKFQNSQFLELMRRLRDREVRVEGDKMVEVSAQSTSSPSTSEQPPQARQPHLPMTAVPEVDPRILDHAATDFAMPVFSGEEQEYARSRQSSLDHVTDEVSDQYSYYNVHAAYHR
ncbi:hypothetical protein N0V90_006562 [Kalmusia sp. IMI 367209]|nr:hypothetical protein N0V90_006562 [Kalmusia sp. IMI 367209]